MGQNSQVNAQLKEEVDKHIQKALREQVEENRKAIAENTEISQGMITSFEERLQALQGKQDEL